MTRHIISPSKFNVPETYQGEYFEYVELIVDTHLFNNADKLEKLVENARTGQDIVRLAIDFEKDTILFFNGLRSLALKEKQAVIDDLIMEEQIHLVKLLRMRKEVAV